MTFPNQILPHTLLLLFFFLSFSIAITISCSDDLLTDLKQKVTDQGGCKTNVCFGMDVSSDMSSILHYQKKLISKTVTVISTCGQAQFSAVNYTNFARQIIGPTTDTDAFVSEVWTSSISDEENTAVGAPIVYCSGQLTEADDLVDGLEDDKGSKGSSTSEGNDDRLRRVIVVLGNGVNEFGGDPSVRAELFRSLGGEVIAVGIGDMNEKTLSKIADDQSSVIRVETDQNVDDVVERLVEKLCF